MPKEHSDMLEAGVPFAREISCGGHLDIWKQIEVLFVFIHATFSLTQLLL